MKIRKLARVIPFGFKSSEEKGLLESVPSEIEALDKAKKYLETCSYREVAEWLHRKTGRYISHVGLRKRINSSTATKAEEESQDESQEVGSGDSQSV